MLTRLTLLLCFISSLVLIPVKQAKSQIDPFIEGKPDDFKELKTRPLVVVLREEDAKVVEKMTKKGKLDELKKYRDNIEQYNQLIKNAVTKYWTFNKQVEYKKESEMKDIFGKSKEYAVLYYTELEDVGSRVSGGAYFFSGLTVPILAYSKSEIKLSKVPDNKIYLPPVSIAENADGPKEWDYMQCSFDFAVRELQTDIKYILKVDKKVNFEDYAEKISKEGHCEKLKQTTVLIGKSHLDEKANSNDIKSSYTGAFNWVDDSTLNNAFVNGEEGKAILFIIPYGIAKNYGAMSIGLALRSKLAYMKVVIDCKTGNVLYVSKSQRDYGWLMTQKSFEDMVNCNEK